MTICQPGLKEKERYAEGKAHVPEQRMSSNYIRAWALVLTIMDVLCRRTVRVRLVVHDGGAVGQVLVVNVFVVVAVTVVVLRAQTVDRWLVKTRKGSLHSPSIGRSGT